MSRPVPVALTGDIDDGLEDFKSCIRPLAESLDSSQVRMTVPVTASALEHNARKLAFLAERGHEIAGHGDVHEPFCGPAAHQVSRLEEMLDQFGRHLGMTPVGFRAPYLAHDDNLFEALAAAGFLYDSSVSATDPLLDLRYSLSPRPLVFRESPWALPRRLKRYVSGQARPRPRLVAGGVVELPVFELDDWFFFEAAAGPHLGAEEEGVARSMWLSALRHFSSDGNVFVLQAHPKRMSPRHLRILEDTIASAKLIGSRFLTLREVALQVKEDGSAMSPVSRRPERRFRRLDIQVSHRGR